MQPALLRGRCCGFLHSAAAAAACRACCYWCLFPHSTTSNTSHWPASVPAVMQGVVYLLARWLRYARTHTHSRAGLVHTQTMDFLMEGPLTLFLHQEYPFHSGSIPYPFRSSHHFYSAPPISLCLSTLVYQPVSGHRLWIRSLWVNL